MEAGVGTKRFIFHFGFDEALRTPGDLEVRLPGSSCLDTGLKWVWLIVGVAYSEWVWLGTIPRQDPVGWMYLRISMPLPGLAQVQFYSCIWLY